MEEHENEQVENTNSTAAKKPRKTSTSRRKSQTVSQTYTSYECNYTTPKIISLSRHMRSHSKEPYKCRISPLSSRTLVSPVNHVNINTDIKPHECDQCDSAFKSASDLIRHVRYRHTDEKPHHCNECDYSCVELSKLKRHTRSHTGERPFQCPHCTYASVDNFKLKIHLRIHTGEKPYECDICQAKFTQSNSLKAHRLIHTGDKPIFKCEICPTTCGRKYDLKTHVQRVHTNKIRNKNNNN